MLGNHTMTDDFYVVEIEDTNIILGAQWLISLGKHFVNYQSMDLEFRVENGRKVVFRGMSNGSHGIVSARRMESIFKYGTKYFPDIDL